MPNALEDSRFAGSPLVLAGPEIRFYAGVPIVTIDGSALGTLCVIDNKPHSLSDVQRRGLRCLARQGGSEIEMRDKMKHLEQETLTDAPTGTRSRRAFDLHLREEWVRHYRHGDWLGLLMIDVDLDHAHSHPDGDSFLARTASILGGNLGPYDYLARYRGDKFAVLLPGKDREAASRVGERIRQSVAAADWDWAPVSVSIGVDSVRRKMELGSSLLVARANRALHHAKQTGGNCVIEFRSWNGRD